MVELLFFVVSLAIGLLLKFWPVLLIIIGYKLFKGQGETARRKRPYGFPPVAGGGIPRPSSVPVPPKPVEYRLPPTAEETPSGLPSAGETAAFDLVEKPAPEPMVPSSSADRDGALSQKKQASPPPAVAAPSAAWNSVPIDPREGMKWSLIFSPPRSRNPYVPPWQSHRPARYK